MANTTRIVPLLIAVMSMSLFFALVPNVLAYVSGPTQSGQLYDEVWSPGHLCANYATVARYDAKGGLDNNPYFFPGIMSHSDTSGPVLFYYVTDLKITVTGMKPDGSPIGGLEFADQAWLDSPHDSGQSWYDLLSFLYDTITGLAPHGASELLKYGQQSTESGWDYNATATWAEWRWNGWIWTRASDKGLQFRFSLHCDPGLTGMYTLNVKYHVEICALTANLNYICAVNKDFYETITYYFGSPKLTISASSGGTTDPAPGTYTYDYDSPVTVTASAYTGYRFDYWLLDGATVFENPINVTMDSDHILNAYFERICNLNIQSSGPGSTSPSGLQTYSEGAVSPPLPFTIPLGDSWTESLDEWSIIDGYGNNLALITPAPVRTYCVSVETIAYGGYYYACIERSFKPQANYIDANQFQNTSFLVSSAGYGVDKGFYVYLMTDDNNYFWKNTYVPYGWQRCTWAIGAGVPPQYGWSTVGYPSWNNITKVSFAILSYVDYGFLIDDLRFDGVKIFVGVNIVATPDTSKYFWFWIINNTELGLKYYCPLNTLSLTLSGNYTHDWNVTAYFGNVNYPKGTYPLTIIGDVNFDGKVDMLGDISPVSRLFGKCSTNPDWESSHAKMYDLLLIPNNQIDIFDIRLVSKQFGKVAP